MSPVSVIIVSYRVRYYIEQCIVSVLRSVPEAQIIVVDNNSADGSVEFLRERFNGITVIANNSNLGFGKANNMALDLVDSPYTLFLNPDTVVAENTIPQCISYLDRTPKAGACGVRMLYADGQFALESRRSVPTPSVCFCHMTGLGRLFPKSHRFAKYHMTFNDKSEDCDIEVISGAFMMVRTDLVRSLGGFDESFFMYGEDIDLSYRILQSGYANRYISAPILHYKGESTVKTSYRYSKVFYDAMLIFYDKHFGRYSHTFSLLVRIAVLSRKLFTFVGQNLLAGRRKLTLEKAPCLFVGKKENFAKAQSLVSSSRHMCSASFVEGCGQPSVDESLLEGSKVVIFDTSVYDYETVLNWMQTTHESGKHIGTGLYYPDTNRLVTEDEILL
ncbi:MAG: glycosyltransferase family 2 protein [Bacteroidaceae bacterium]|nr:glycosyltransferase family 2 protein [Bacteroidaceae bacterium]